MPNVEHSPANTRSKGAVPKITGISGKRKEKEAREHLEMEEELRKMRKEIDELRARSATKENEMRQEILRLQTTSTKQDEEIRSLQGQSDAGNQSQLLGELVSKLQKVQIDVKTPAFRGEEHTNPREFLEELENYFVIKNISENQKVLVAKSCLGDRAKMWMMARGGVITNYEGFREQFLDEFYSTPIQIKFKSRWNSRHYRIQDGSLQTYFLTQIKEAKYFIPEMSAFETNYTTIQQMPWRVRDALTVIDFADTKRIIQALAHLDLGQEDRDRDRRRPPANRANETDYGNPGVIQSNNSLRAERNVHNNNFDRVAMPDTNHPPPMSRYDPNNRAHSDNNRRVNLNG